MNPFDLTNKNIIISGASSGIGRQCAINCSEMGASVVLLGRNKDRLQETIASMNFPEKHSFYSFDLTNLDGIPNLISEIIGKSGKINGILHAAGISTTLPIKLVTKEKLDTFFQTNVYSAYILTKEVCKIGNFSENGGSIVFFSSIMGIVGEKGKSLYSMTKGALNSLTRSLSCEFSKRKIRVNTISPGVIITPINEHFEYISNPEKRKLLEEKHLLGLGKTEDVANACIYLLSDASKWVTGINLIVDGGYTAQ
jgi:NAD(P)-dependent dehydrogenase (short-subunit alcohol dehydrogenase family)